MLELPHTVIGAAIGTKVNSPLLAFILALASHFVIDLIPHWNPSLYSETKKIGKPSKLSTKIVIIDTVVSLIFGFWAAFRVWPDLSRFLTIITCCFLAVFPDVIEAPYFYFGFRPPILRRLIEFQHRHQGRTTKTVGLLIESLATVLACTYLFP